MKKALPIFALTMAATSFSFAEESANETSTEETTAIEETRESTCSETTTACGGCPIKK